MFGVDSGLAEFSSHLGAFVYPRTHNGGVAKVTSKERLMPAVMGLLNDSTAHVLSVLQHDLYKVVLGWPNGNDNNILLANNIKMGMIKKRSKSKYSI